MTIRTWKYVILTKEMYLKLSEYCINKLGKLVERELLSQDNSVELSIVKPQKKSTTSSLVEVLEKFGLFPNTAFSNQRDCENEIGEESYQ
jgi:hypothetical protein